MTEWNLSTSNKLNLSKVNGFILRKNHRRYYFLEDTLTYLNFKVLYHIESYDCVRLASNYKWKVFFLKSTNVIATKMNSYILNTVSVLLCKLVILMQR